MSSLRNCLIKGMRLSNIFSGALGDFLLQKVIWEEPPFVEALLSLVKSVRIVDYYDPRSLQRFDGADFDP